MQPEERDLAYLWDMRAAAREVAAFVEGVPFARYQADVMRRRAVERQLEVLGEAARRVSTTFQAAHPDVPWRAIIGLRNVLAHDYGEIVDERVYRVATDRIPELLAQMSALLPPGDPP